MTQYFGFGGRLYHEVPAWVERGAVFHVRIRCASDNPVPLTEPVLAGALLDSVRFYQARQVWCAVIFLLMPDHLHALLAFGRDKSMSRVIGDWKRYHATKNRVRWQEGYFDHRLRDDRQLELKYQYIMNNPVAKGLCATPEGWPWWIVHSTCAMGDPTRAPRAGLESAPPAVCLPIAHGMHDPPGG